MDTPANPNSFNFLAHPPPTPKATVRTIFRRRSSTKTTISTWVAGILPDSPTPESPPVPSTFSRRPSLSYSSRSRRPKSPISVSASPVPRSKVHTPELRTSTYACTVVPLPIPPYTSAPSQSSFPAERQFDNPPDEMKLSRLLMRPNKASAPLASPHSPAPPKKKGLVSFLRSRPRFRSTHTRHPLPPTPSAHACNFPPPPASSPTTIAFRIAGQKRAFYTQRGLLPLPLDSEVAIMQFVDGGSRADAVARLGATYKDEAGVIYADEAEAGECLPLLLVADNDPDDSDTSGGLPSAHSGGASGRLAFTPAPPSHLSPTSSSPETALHSPEKSLASPSRRALFSIPARGGGSSAPRYLHVTHPSLPPHFGGLGTKTKTQFSPSVEVTASRRKQRRRPAPLVLHLQASAVGFEDSFVPNVVVEVPSPTAQEAGAGPKGDIDAQKE